MFPGSNNKKVLSSNLVTILKESHMNELDNSETYLGDTMNDDLKHVSQSKKPLLLSTYTDDESITKTKTKTKTKSRLTSSQELFSNKSDFSSYDLDSVLKTNVDELRPKHNEQIFMCPYQINTQSLKPFLSYLLYKSNDVSEPYMYFPYFNCVTNEPLSEQTINQLDTLIGTEKKTDIKGYLKYDKNIFIFMKISEFENDPRENKYIWCLIDEIINKRKVFNFSIHNSIYQIFTTYPKLLFIFDKDGNPYESPSSVYTGNQYDYSVHNSVFGIRKSVNQFKSLGDFYIFYDYETAVKHATTISQQEKENLEEEDLERITIKDSDKFKKGGVVRYAIFTGKMKVFLRENLDELTLEDNHNWTIKYNSAFIGKLTLQNGEQFEDAPLIITEEYEQQIPLSLVEINN